MRFASAFSGIEAASSAWHPLGWETAVVIEFDAFPSAVLAHHYPDVPNLGDITQVTEDQIKALGQLDVFVFGSPCQDLSVAGKRKGLDGERSGLFFDAMRLVRWMRQHCGLRWAVWENVPGAFSSNKGADFAAVVAALGGFDAVDVPPKGWGTEGAAAGPEALVEWSTLDAQWFGVAQRRRRCFAVADFGAWAGRPPVLLEPDRLRGDSAPSREAGKVAPATPARSLGGGGLGTDFDCDGGLVRVEAFGGNNQAGAIDVATARNACASASGRMDFESETFLVQQTAHTLRGEGFDASEDGTGRGTPLVPVLPFDTTQITSAANRSNPKAGDPCHPLAAGAHAPAIAFDSRQDPVSSNQVFGALGSSSPQAQAVAFQTRGSNIDVGDIAGTFGTNADRASGSAPMALQNMQVRRLTPRECERLQGFPDDHTLIPWTEYKRIAKAAEKAGVSFESELKKRGKVLRTTVDDCPDGPRYKALGNSMAVPVMRWIGQRIEFAHLYF